MAAPLRPTMRTASRCTLETARGTHAFEITGHSLHKGLGPGKFIRSAPFSVGGYDWRIIYYPDGDGWEENEDYVSLSLVLVRAATVVRALFDLRLVDQATGLSSVVYSVTTPFLFSTKDNANMVCCIHRSDLEESAFLRDDRLVIECDITVLGQQRVAKTAGTYEVQVPPSDLSDNFRKLLEGKEGADVTFKVEGELFPAHKIVLATRSPVFRVELYGPIGDNKRECITIEDMKPPVFRELLHFIYTDSMPDMGYLDGDDKKEMIKHLLVAADRYAMERLKLLCEGALCKTLDVENVATTLALADQHHCSYLKDACIEFINSSNRMEDVVASQGYVRLKRACPAVLVDLLETVKSRKI